MFPWITPTLAVGAWVGFDDFQTSIGRSEGGSKAALPIFVKVMKKIGGKNSRRFTRPAGISDVKIDKATGLLAAHGVTEEVYTEVFLPGSAPVEVAPRPNEDDKSSYAIGLYDDDESLPGEDDEPSTNLKKPKPKPEPAPAPR